MKLRNCVNRPARNLKLLDLIMGMRIHDVTLSLPNTAILFMWNLIVHIASVFNTQNPSVTWSCLAVIRPLLYFKTVVQYPFHVSVLAVFQFVEESL